METLDSRMLGVPLRTINAESFQLDQSILRCTDAPSSCGREVLPSFSDEAVRSDNCNDSCVNAVSSSLSILSDDSFISVPPSNSSTRKLSLSRGYLVSSASYGETVTTAAKSDERTNFANSYMTEQPTAQRAHDERKQYLMFMQKGLEDKRTKIITLRHLSLDDSIKSHTCLVEQGAFRSNEVDDSTKVTELPLGAHINVEQLSRPTSVEDLFLRGREDVLIEKNGLSDKRLLNAALQSEAVQLPT